MIAAALAGAAPAAACGGNVSRPRPESPVSLTLPALDGGAVRLSAHRGQPILLHLFATWVPAAHLDAAKLSAAHRRHGRRIEIIGVALDPDGRPLVAPWRAAVGAPYLITLATDALREGRTGLGKIRQLPTTVIIDSRGRVAARIERPLRPGELERAIGRLLPTGDDR